MNTTIKNTLEQLERSYGIVKTVDLSNGSVAAIATQMDNNVFSVHFDTIDVNGLQGDTKSLGTTYSVGDIRAITQAVTEVYISAIIHHGWEMFELAGSCPKRLKLYKKVLERSGIKTILTMKKVADGIYSEVMKVVSVPEVEVEPISKWELYGGGKYPVQMDDKSVAISIEMARKNPVDKLGILLEILPQGLEFENFNISNLQYDLELDGQVIVISRTDWDYMMNQI